MSSAEAKPPKELGPLARREAWLAYALLAPTFLIVACIVLFPLLANFWISFKPLQLGDLRPPTPTVNERLRGGDDVAGGAVTLQYRVRNTSPSAGIGGVTLTDSFPAGITPTVVDPRCTVDGATLHCDLGDLPGGFSEAIEIEGTVGEAFLSAGVDPRDDAPVVTGSSVNALTSLTFTFDNFTRFFAASDFWDVVRTTVIYTVFSTAGATVVGLFAALLLNSAFPGRGLLRGLFLFPYIAPVISVTYTWVLLLDPFSGTLNAILLHMNVIDGPINFFGQRYGTLSLFGLSITYPQALTWVIVFEAWRYFPLAFLFILARMQSIGSDMYEAAEVDGATPLQQFWYLSLPHLLGVMAVLFLLRFIWNFNKFDDIFLLTGGASGTRTLTVSVFEKAFALSDIGGGAAVAVVVFVALLIFSLFYFRALPKGEGL